MKESEPIKLQKRKDKLVFLDTVVLGIVFLMPKTEMELKSFIKNTRENMYIIWNEEKTYVTIDWEKLPSQN